MPITALTTSDTFATWYTRINSLITADNAALKLINDTDNDTKIQVEESSDEDIIRFDIAGTQYATYSGAGLLQLNQGTATTTETMLHMFGATTPTLTIEDSTNTVKLVAFANNTVGTVGTSTAHSLFLEYNGTEHLAITSAGIVANDTGAAGLDFRIETDNDAYMFYVDGGKDALVFGSNTDVSSTDTPFLIDYTARSATGSTNFDKFKVGGTNAITVPSGTTALVTGIHIAEPNLTATGTITTSAALYIAAAATEGGSNFAIFVDGGISRFDGAIHGLEISTPSAITNYWSFYSKTDNKAYFQDGAGTEHEMALAADAKWAPGTIYDADLVTGSDANHDINFPAIKCRDEADTKNITATAYVKRGDAAFAEGTLAGMAAGSVSLPTSGTIHFFIIEKDSAAGTFDFMMDTSVTGASGVSGWTVRRRVGSRRTDSSANIIGALQFGDWHEHSGGTLLAYHVSNPGTSQVTVDVLTPKSIYALAVFTIKIFDQTPQGGFIYLKVQDLAQTDVSPTSANHNLQIDGDIPGGGSEDTQSKSIEVIVRTNVDASVGYKMTASDTDVSVGFTCRGWYDRRGRDG